MKQWKESLAQQLVDECVDRKIVSLRDIAIKAGMRHIDRQDAQDVALSAVKRVPDYRLVRGIKI